MNQPLILYVEDDETLRFITSENLERQGFNVLVASDGAEGLALFKRSKPDLCVFDVMLPKMDGFTLARIIREEDQQVPILFVTAKSLREDKIEGLLLGGDDYLVKPFSLEELVLKIRIFLKRSGVKTLEPSVPGTKIGNLEFHRQNMTLTGPGHLITLTYREAELLQYFIDHNGVLVTREEILESIWGGNDYFAGRSLDVFISRLRKYLSVDQTIKIENRHGIGFRLICGDE